MLTRVVRAQYFLRSDSLGVADGVGGWSGHAGANSARWARKFMHRASSSFFSLTVLVLPSSAC